ncbi:MULTISPECIES: DUF2232 domain-containing protein [Prochlorococcus]|uniref:DUF2232 domain-containing protein n=2 Tax=Prochlorococcus TaxID=1218 RepID=UPI0007B35D69|nr:DUF2232 domain-containing protein [Prochlorococcus marinus]MEC7737527.1 DUF2232 domain-containing protein [Cyanobacteriota bacterium]MED5164696.1 DUF2232 domain-containing protein [Cyanobacteriota bacterium]|tara:strand:- start:51 stop:659 length:609 start_codon:yes stop_codon:yes gene_type:complete
MMETSYLAAASALIWVALYYLPVGGALFRLALPLPLALLHVRRGSKAGLEGVALAVLLLIALMGPVRGPLVLFPYGFLALWLGWSWHRGLSWWVSWGCGVVIGTAGFLVRVVVLSLLVGENLWVVITRAGSGLLDRLVDLLNLPLAPDLNHVQLMAFALVVFQELVYVLVLHALAFWIFPRLQGPIPEPPRLLHGLVALDPL